MKTVYVVSGNEEVYGVAETKEAAEWFALRNSMEDYLEFQEEDDDMIPPDKVIFNLTHDEGDYYDIWVIAVSVCYSWDGFFIQ